MKKTAQDRFWAKVDTTGECWLWIGGRHDGDGYGGFFDGQRQVLAHRFAYEMAFGPIPAGLEIDHACHNADKSCNLKGDCPHRRCVRPSHLEAVPHRENCQRGQCGATTTARQKAKTHCPKGHPYNAENTYRYRTMRYCRACNGKVRFNMPVEP